MHLQLNNGDHNIIMWTPVHVRQFKLTDVPAELVSQDIPISQLLDMDSIVEESLTMPLGLIVLKKGRLEV